MSIDPAEKGDGIIYTETILTLFEAVASQFPSNIALEHHKQTMTYEVLNQKANQFARHLNMLGIKPDMPVALCLERSFDLLIAILAILKVGAAYVPLDPSHPEKRLSHILHDSNPSILITKVAFKQKFSSFQGQLVTVDDTNECFHYETSNLEEVIKPHYLAYIIYTSGSTGKPKGVLIEHSNLIYYVRWFANYCHCQPGLRVDFSANYIFDMAITTSIVSLALNLTVVICDDSIKKDIRQFLVHLHDNDIQMIKITPTYFKELLHEVKRTPITLPVLQHIILGGEALHTVDCQDWLSIYKSHYLYNEYGPTETTVAVLQYLVTKENMSFDSIHVPIGRMSADGCFYILDKEGALVAPGEVGELYVGGASVARGYLNQPQMTADKFVNHIVPAKNDGQSVFYKTGDLCRCLTDGTIEYLGRIDRQVKVRGFRVELGEVERHLIAHPDIEDAIVLARSEKSKEPRLVAYYILKDQAVPLSFHQLSSYSKTQLLEHMIPAVFILVDKFPLNDNGKLDEAALPKVQFRSSQSYIAPSKKDEKLLAIIWSEELHIQSIGIHDNFFELGGHSLIAARIISKIRLVLEKEIALPTFYAAPTISKLLRVLKKTKKIKKSKKELAREIKTVSHVNRKHNIALSDFQFMIWISDLFEPKVKKLNTIARRQIVGLIDMTTLNLAFESIIHKHEIFRYWIGPFSVKQRLQKMMPFQVIEKNLCLLSPEQRNFELLESLNELINFHSWQSNMPMLMARIFEVQNDVYELQISMPHRVCDDASIDILFNELSQFYMLHKHQQVVDNCNHEMQFKDYLFKEQDTLNKNLHRDISYWKRYLNDACMLTIPPQYVVAEVEEHSFTYSTYVEIPEPALKSLRQHCAEERVSVIDLLCAALGVALKTHCSHHVNDTKKLLMNVVKSTRNDQSFDKTIGCFLSIYPIKVDSNTKQSVTRLAKEVQRTMLDNYEYQNCSSIVKFACIAKLNELYGKQRSIKNYVAAFFAYCYARACRVPRLSVGVFNLLKQLVSFDRKPYFVVNVNLWSNFLEGGESEADIKVNFKSLDSKGDCRNLVSISGSESQSILFESKPHNMVSHHYDLLKINYLFDVCFMKDDNTKLSYIVISSNTTPEFRTLIANEIIRVVS